jgi:hypothetical protein
MKKFLLVVGVVGGAAFALRRLPRHAAAFHEHCRRCFSGCGEHEQPNDPM